MTTRRRQFLAAAMLAAFLTFPLFGQEASGPVPLVKIDYELNDWVRKAEKSIKTKDYDEAIKILQALIEKPDAGFVEASSGRKDRYVSLRTEATRLLGTMGPEGLKQYRRLYDPKAQRLYEQAVQDGNTGALLRIVHLYHHSSFGPKALERLAALDFDRGHFRRALRRWRELLSLEGESRRAEILARMAVAAHLAGLSQEAEQLTEELEEHHPDAQAMLGGTQQALVDFVKAVLSRPPLDRPAARVRRRQYLGWGGTPNGVALMGECEVVLLPRWRHPEAESDIGIDDLIVPDMRLAMQYGNNQAKLWLEGGQVRAKLTSPAFNRAGQSDIALPAVVRPVVYDDWVIYRSEESVVAVDIYTGKLAWQSLPLPVMADSSATTNYRGWVGFIDNGQYGLTIGGGMVFTLYGLNPPLINNRNQSTPQLRSSLGALSLDNEGMLLWTVGADSPEESFLSQCRFMSLPTYWQPTDADSGRLYLTALHLENYYLLCLDAFSGELLWKTEISQTSVLGGRRYGYDPLSQAKAIGTPPVISGGRVFAANNAGVLAAFDAALGTSLWAYQYESKFATTSPNQLVRAGQAPPSGNVNPMLALDDTIVALPCDSSKLLALSMEDGTPVWSNMPDRGPAVYLSAIDADQVLLSGGSHFKILSVQDGQTIFASGDFRNQTGRPAVTPSDILISGEGVLYRLDLENRQSEPPLPVEPEGLLGNLVSVDGKLISANTLGICGFFTFQDAFAELTERMDKASGLDLAELCFERAHLCFSAKRYDEALENFQACRTQIESLANPGGGSDLNKRLRPWLYRTYIALGNAATGPQRDEVMLAMFREANALAETPGEKAYMLVRLARYYERVGEFAESVAMAQRLADEYGDESLVEVKIGPDADPRIYPGRDPKTRTGRQIGQGLIQRLVKIHGPGVYERFDRLAAQALRDAVQVHDAEAMEDVADRWPHSQHTGDALLAAAEQYYRGALSKEDEEGQYLLAQATRVLNRLVQESDAHRPSAIVALMLIYKSAGLSEAARITRNELDDVSMETPVAFADIQGSLGDVLDAIEKGTLRTRAIMMAHVQMIRPPLQVRYNIDDDMGFMLCDQTYEPVRIGEMLLLQKSGQTILLDTGTQRMDRALRMAAKTHVDPRKMQRYGYYVPGLMLIGGMSLDRQTVVVADRTGATAFRSHNAEMLWHRTIQDIGLKQAYSMAVGGDMIVYTDPRDGSVVALDIHTGEIRWKGSLKKTQTARSLSANPPMIESGHVAVLYSGNRGLCVFDAKNGELRLHRDAKRQISMQLNDTGALAIMVDGTLEVFDLSAEQMKTPVSSRTYDMNQWPGLLAISDSQLAVSPSRQGARVEVLPLEDMSAKATVLDCGKINGQTMAPIDARFDGETGLYVSCTLHTTGVPATQAGYPRHARGVGVVRFDTANGEMTWRRQLKEPTGGNNGIVYPIVLGREHLAVTIRGIRPNEESHCMVLRKQDGDIVQEIDVMGEPASDQTRDIYNRMRSLGRAVMTNGQLTVETLKGVTVYGGS